MDIATLLTVISSISSGLAVLVALFAILAQTRQNNLVLKANTLQELYEKFYFSDGLRRVRLETSIFLLNRKDDTPPIPIVADLLDFFDITGMYLKQGIIDSDTSHSTLYYWLAHYWKYIEKDADYYERVSSGLANYDNLRFLYKELTKVARKKKRVPPISYYSTDNLNTFLEEEISVCSAQLNELPKKTSKPRKQRQQK